MKIQAHFCHSPHRWRALRLLALFLGSTLGLSLIQPAAAATIWQTQTVDNDGAVGQYTSLALDSKGYPLISYYDSTNSDLKVAHCGDATCRTGNTVTTVDSAGDVGTYNSLTLDSNGNPVISYHDETNLDLKLVHCGDATCSSGNIIVTVDSAGFVGRYTSLALDNSGNPVISYQDVTNLDLKLVHCGDATCSSGNTIQTVDSDGTTGHHTSLALDSSGNPVISYVDFTHSDLKLAHCGNATCSSGNTIQTADSAGSVGGYNSLVLDHSGNPVISYFDETNLDLKFVHCGDATCSSANTIVTLDNVGDVGGYTSLALDNNGNPVISYYDHTKLDLKLVHCGDTICSSDNTIQAADNAGSIGWYTSLALDSSGNPVISYYDVNNTALKVARLVDDITAPVITANVAGTLGNNGWYVSNVTVSWSVADAESVVSAQNGCDPTVLTSDTASITLTCTATSEGGTSSQSVTFKLDKTPPTLNPVVSPNPVVLGGAVSVTSGAADSLSGLASQSCTALDTNSVGIKNVTCTATDNAGNTASATAEYTIVLPPLLQQVQTVRTNLAALLPSGDKKNDERLNKALGKIDKATAANLWQPDGNHLALIGDDVFNRLQDAVQELAKLKNPPSAVRTLATTLVGISRSLAQIALDEAISGSGNASKIAKAQSKLSKGDSEAAKGKADKAIANYEDCWEYAQQALGYPVAASLDANQLVFDDAGDPSESDPEALPFHLFLPVVNR